MLVVTTAPGVRMDLILLIVPPLAVDVKAMKLLPPRDWQGARGKADWLNNRAGHVLRADRLGADLAEEVDLDRRVDGDHVVVLADDVRVVDVFDRQDLHGRVIVDIVINAL